LCGACKQVKYCSQGCQKAHWKQHKPICKSLKKEELSEKEQLAKKLAQAKRNMRQKADKRGPKYKG